MSVPYAKIYICYFCVLKGLSSDFVVYLVKLKMIILPAEKNTGLSNSRVWKRVVNLGTKNRWLRNK